jgi:hypothetical protein
VQSNLLIWTGEILLLISRLERIVLYAHSGSWFASGRRQTMVRSLWLANYSLLELAIIPNGDVTGQSWHSLASLIACVTQFFATNV